MRQIQTAQVGPDGVLTLTMQLGEVNANKIVRVTVETVEGARPARPFASQEEWRRFVEETAGKWQGEFERPPQGELQERDPL